MRSTRPLNSVVVLFAIAFLLGTTPSLAAGIQGVKVPADGKSPSLSGAIWYPCSSTPDEIMLGPFTLTATKDCPVMGTNLPLVVMWPRTGG